MDLKTHNAKVVSWNLTIGAMSLIRYNWVHRDVLVLLQPIEFEIAMDSSKLGQTTVNLKKKMNDFFCVCLNFFFPSLVGIAENS